MAKALLRRHMSEKFSSAEQQDIPVVTLMAYNLSQ
jgi:hypothetical protein